MSRDTPDQARQPSKRLDLATAIRRAGRVAMVTGAAMLPVAAEASARTNTQPSTGGAVAETTPYHGSGGAAAPTETSSHQHESTRQALLQEMKRVEARLHEAKPVRLAPSVNVYFTQDGTEMGMGTAVVGKVLQHGKRVTRYFGIRQPMPEDRKEWQLYTLPAHATTTKDSHIDASLSFSLGTPNHFGIIGRTDTGYAFTDLRFKAPDGGVTDIRNASVGLALSPKALAAQGPVPFAPNINDPPRPIDISVAAPRPQG